VSDSSADALLQRAEAEPTRLRRHLLVAAALSELLSARPIVVGGTAEEYWTAAEYHQTDLDVCVPITAIDRASLRGAGFSKSGRHWVHRASDVAVEIPEPRIDGSEERVITERVAGGRAHIIGLEDLYLDRLRQSTVSTSEGVEFNSAVAVAGARFTEMDWPYVERRVRETERLDPSLGRLMREKDRRIRSRVRRRLAT
jgi:hypothetical protein